ncbi:MAG: PAS domain-containing protein [Myxococcota bacterium]
MRRPGPTTRETLTLLADAADGLAFTADSAMRFTGMYGAWLTRHGVVVEDVVGRSLGELVSPADRGATEAEWRRALEGERRTYLWSDPARFEGRTFRVVVSPLHDDEGCITGIMGVVQDVTDARTARAEWEQFFSLSADLLCVLHVQDWTFERVNSAWGPALGLEPQVLLGRSLQERVHPKDCDAAARALRSLLQGESRSSFETRFQDGDGEYRWLVWSCTAPVPGTAHVLAMARDVTQERRAELEHRQAQKLEAVGRLAAGIAHEINTPVQFIGDSVHFLRGAADELLGLLEHYDALHAAAITGRIPEELLAAIPRAREDADVDYLREHIPQAINRALDGVGRVASIVRAMKDFAHPDQREKTLADLNKALQSTLTVARNELKYVAEVSVDLGELPLVYCHIGDLNQVFLNLLVNAAHAISDVVKGTDDKGLIRVRTMVEGSSVVIAISDTGAGIPEAVRSRIFEPFFTTKEVGRGTGQGLAIARSIVVERHKGSLTFDTELGVGTTFYIRLPVEGAPENVASAGES